MPYPNAILWFTVFSYVPEFDSQQLKQISDQLIDEERSENAQKVLFPGIYKQINNNCIQFNSKINKSPNNTFKFHISIDPKDYNKVLNSQLNALVQQALVAKANQTTLTAYKCVDPLFLKKSQQTELQFLQGMNRLYFNIKKFKNTPGLNERTHLYSTINQWHTWVQTSWNELFPKDPFPQLKNLFDVTINELELNRLKHTAQFRVIQDESQRMLEQIQFTLYVHVDAKTENLVALINTISNYLAELKIAPLKSCAESDLPLTDYVSFRQERYSIDGQYISAKSTDYAQLKEKSKSSEAYGNLLEQLNELKHSQFSAGSTSYSI